jgi:8-oxo-dGTP pyrophosphatase MutT (NUDIX family)
MSTGKGKNLSTGDVPLVLHMCVSKKDLAQAVKRRFLRAAKGKTLTLHERRGAAKRSLKAGVLLRVAARSAAAAGVEFTRSAKERYETERLSLKFAACAKLPSNLRNMPRVDAAGGVVVSMDEHQRVLLLLKKNGKNARWVLPKGKRRRLEARRCAAKREVLEETGLVRVDMGKFLFRERYFDVEKGRVVFKQVSYYLMRCPKGKTRLKVQRIEGFLRGSWVSFETAFHETNPVRAHGSLRKAREAARPRA